MIRSTSRAIIWQDRHRLPAQIALVLLSLVLLNGCSLRSMAVGAMADAMARSSTVYARDDDPEFVREALPFGLKTMEGLLLEKPRHKGLLLSACSGFTQYAQAFVVQPADRLEETDLTAARAERRRAARLFLRARGYCVRALEVVYPGLVEELSSAPERVLGRTRKKDVPLLYWTGASWAAAINVSKGDLDLVADVNVAHALLKRALALDPTWDDGAIHELLIVLEAALAPAQGGSIEKAREHFRQAWELSGSRRIGALVTLAESVAVKEQELAEFKQLLQEALAFDIETAPDLRLASTLAHRRAEWLLGRTGELFVEAE